MTWSRRCNRLKTGHWMSILRSRLSSKSCRFTRRTFPTIKRGVRLHLLGWIFRSIAGSWTRKGKNEQPHMNRDKRCHDTLSITIFPVIKSFFQSSRQRLDQVRVPHHWHLIIETLWMVFRAIHHVEKDQPPMYRTPWVLRKGGAPNDCSL